ncbi:hypothetical protein LBMAG21_06100 [Armatimonadota bacterium]|nr:hypothetical protein LBMAG21_06100 [Armatimonadota bacterium]
MLQHEQEEQRGYVSPISNLRVTPSELAQAVAAIESRREGIEQDTIAIGDAIEQLGLRVSPQDVYSEIQRQQNVKRLLRLPLYLLLPRKVVSDSGILCCLVSLWVR